jgi:hypothetical protein
VNEQTHKLKDLLKNIQLEIGSGVDIPAGKKFEGMQKINHQRMGNARTYDVNQSTQHRDEATGRRGGAKMRKPMSESQGGMLKSTSHYMSQFTLPADAKKSNHVKKLMTPPPPPRGLILESQTHPGYSRRSWFIKGDD